MDANPTGAPRPPPNDLASRALPLRLLHGLRMQRVHRTAHQPIFFSPGAAARPLGRFDSATLSFGVLYAAETLAGAFAETVLRNPARRLVAMADIESRSLSALQVSRSVSLVDLRGPGLQRLGLDASIATGPYDNCGLWADALFCHASRPDGILYRSRHDPGQICIALFQRDDLDVTQAGDRVPLSRLLPDVAALLRRYGKGLDV